MIGINLIKKYTLIDIRNILSILNRRIEVMGDDRFTLYFTMKLKASFYLTDDGYFGVEVSLPASAYDRMKMLEDANDFNYRHKRVRLHVTNEGLRPYCIFPDLEGMSGYEMEYKVMSTFLHLMDVATGEVLLTIDQRMHEECIEQQKWSEKVSNYFHALSETYRQMDNLLDLHLMPWEDDIIWVNVVPKSVPYELDRLYDLFPQKDDYLLKEVAILIICGEKKEVGTAVGVQLLFKGDRDDRYRCCQQFIGICYDNTKLSNYIWQERQRLLKVAVGMAMRWWNAPLMTKDELRRKTEEHFLKCTKSVTCCHGTLDADGHLSNVAMRCVDELMPLVNKQYDESVKRKWEHHSVFQSKCYELNRFEDDLSCELEILCYGKCIILWVVYCWGYDLHSMKLDILRFNGMKAIGEWHADKECVKRDLHEGIARLLELDKLNIL